MAFALSGLLPTEEPIASRGLLRFNTLFDSTLRNGSWNYLSFTEREVSSLETILAKNRLKPVVRRGMAATEGSFKRLGQSGASPRVLHVATHGFFFPAAATGEKNARKEEGNQVFKRSDNPMIRAGLLLAGANRAGKGEPQRDIQGNEGVYGLQRAFKVAGAKYVLMSLWQVPDKQTSQLMTSFYTNWLQKKMPIPEAFRIAQKQMRDLGLEPYKWAGFVLVE